MHRAAPHTTLAIAALLVLAACGGDDDTDAAPTTTAGASPDTTLAVAPKPSPEACEDIPDPADYPADQIPQAVRPCELPTELTVHVIREGSGHAAEAGDSVVVDYTGIRAADGSAFDTSYGREAPFTVPLGVGRVIAGWDEGLLDAQTGALIKLDIPSDLAYGDNPPAGSGIEPGDDLSFVVDVRAVIPAVTPEDAPTDLDIPPSEGATEVTTVDLVVGDGDIVEQGDTALVHLLLVRGDNEVILYNTWERNQPSPVPLIEGGIDAGAPLAGLVEGLEGMAVGGQRIITMPPDAAFGPDGEGSLGLPAGVDLVIVAELVGAY